ncbi:hypothetical protein ACVIIV_005702 [Bradyrhizobium sp. USDA 4354]
MRDEIAANSHRALGYYLSVIFSGNRFTLCANAALRVRIMLYDVAPSGFRCIAAGRWTG